MLMQDSGCLLVLVLGLLAGAQAFVPVGGGGSTHVTITGNAVLKKITEVCRDVAESEGREFNPTGSSAEELLQACLGTATGEVSAAKFRAALNQIYMQNGLVDRDFMTSDPHHFNSEAFTEGRTLISQGTASIKANVHADNFQSARETLGRVCHTLQDFYSHSNWVELGSRTTYPNLIRPDLPIGNIADVDTPTCIDCASVCPNPLLPSILAEKKLTSGYMGLFSSTKPTGKCSHGGASDLSSTQNPRGGIGKDERRVDNVELHNTAVTLATEATMEILEDIRGAVGNNDFLRLMGIARSSVLCFVIDTTGSMSDDIAEAKRVANNIIDTKKGTQDEPSEYILVPFNDPNFGPLIRTTDPEVMKSKISELKASGGGDIPEMCLSGLQLALTGAPSSSHIYVFTDAVAKDMDLEKTIIALIRSTKSTVSFFMTPKKSRRRRSPKALSRANFRVYYDLALASGGQAIEVTKANLPQATDIIVDSSTAALVTILQRARDPGRVESFPFLLDGSVSNVTVYITGNSALKFTLRSPSGGVQSHTTANGPLGTIQKVGNLWRIRLNVVNQTGMWQIDMDSTAAYTLKVTGQSTITFLSDFVEEFKGPHPGFASIDGRPKSGLPAILLVTLTGRSDSLTLQQVALVEVSSTNIANGTIQEIGGGDFLVTIDKVPQGEFVVLVKGEDETSSSLFQRQSTTQMSVSKVTIKAVVNGNMLPGEQYKLPFTVTTNGTGGKYAIRARNDREMSMSVPSSLTLESGGSATGAVTLTAPADTPSGTDVTLTIEAEAPGGADSNYAVLRLSVVAKVTDFTPPVCELVYVNANCSSNCSLSSWDLLVNVTDVNGTGVAGVTVQQGGGNISLVSVGDQVIQGLYTASCCSPDVTIVAVDRAGNVGRYSTSIRSSTTAAPTTMPNASPPSLSSSLALWMCLLLSSLIMVWDFLPLSL